MVAHYGKAASDQIAAEEFDRLDLGWWDDPMVRSTSAFIVLD
jgi:hypothetical protein